MLSDRHYQCLVMSLENKLQQAQAVPQFPGLLTAFLTPSDGGEC